MRIAILGAGAAGLCMGIRLKQPGIDSSTIWYKTASGTITNNWSGFTVEYWRRTRRPDFEAFEPRP